MPQLTILYWRDMPAQVLVGRGRRAAKAPLPERFEQAIDRAAMATGLTGTDAYLAAWRKGEPVEVEGDPQQVADDAIAWLDAEYDQDRLKTLIANGGHAPA